MATIAFSPISLTRSLTTFPSSDSINSRIRFSTSPAFTKPFSNSIIGNAIPLSSTKNTLFIFCSAYNGHATIGTPAQTPSRTEFHPQ
ncbi:hypothetical protein ACHQM5_011262 [Ranunculus cassubicifolius]